MNTPGNPLPIIRPRFIVAALGLVLAGCATYQQQDQAINSNWQHGDLNNAVIEATKKADAHANDKDAVIWRLEEGAALRADGKYADSNQAFDQAQDKIDQYAQEARIKLGHEAGALLSNPANLPYTGRAYDGIMLNTYEALNYLALGEPDQARPELIRAYQRQQDAVEDNKRRIEQLQNEAATSTNRVAIQKARHDSKFQAAIGGGYGDLDNLKPYADYVNPFTVYLDGLYFMADAADDSDLEHARKSFQRVATLLGDNDYIQQDLAAVDDLMNGKKLTPTTYVIFETGCAPARGQIRIDIPTFWPELPYLGAAFPTLKIQNDYLPRLTVIVNNSSLPTTLLSSMDGVVGRDFKNELPAVITKTLISTAVKAAATHFAWQATRHKQANGKWDDGGIAGALVLISATSWSAANNIADERTWTTLPKEFQFCRFPTPPDRKVELVSPDGLQKAPVTIADGTVNVIYVKSVNHATPLAVSQFKLK